MAFNIFKKEEAGKEEPKKPASKTAKAPKVAKSGTKAPFSGKNRKKSGKAFLVLSSPRITEKASNLTAQDQYVFNVWKEANKIELKRAIEDIYSVEVISVNTINVPKKARRVGRRTGFKKGFKKAIVTLRKGQKIEVLPV
jgi:large subunit ribosomal protein L23